MITAPRLSRMSSLLFVVLGIGFASGAGYWFGRRSGSIESSRAAVSEEGHAHQAGPSGESIRKRVQDGQTQIIVPPNMVRSGSLQSVAVHRTQWLEERTVPAKLELDPARHYAVTAPAEVIVEDLVVPLGMRAERGMPLLEMSSSQITTLRGGLVRQQLLTEKAKRALEYHTEIRSRIETIVEMVRANLDPVPERWIEFDNEKTADFGAKIISAYAKFWSASQISKISQRASNSGVVAERTFVERMTELESAKAMLQGAIEQSRFEVQQAILAAESDLAAAEGSLQSIQSDMRRFLGMGAWDSEAALALPKPSNPDRFIHRSPGDGVVLERYFANGERASMGELIVLVADTTRLWLIGDLRQQDWDLLNTVPGDTVEAEIVGLESLGRIPAAIEMVGGVVQSNSGSIRLTASIENDKQLLRPGMIARLVLSTPLEGMLVPATSVFSNDGVDYILRQNSETVYSLVQVRVGSRKQNSAEILEGLNEGDQILISGVFPIASQAFLEEEE